VLISAGATQSQTINFSNAADFVSFDGTFGAGSIVGGGGADTLNFLSTSRLNGGVISLGSNIDQVTFGGTVSGSSIFSGGGADTLKFGAQTTAVFADALASNAQVSFSSAADFATFSGVVSGSTIFSGGGADTLRFGQQTTAVFADALADNAQVSFSTRGDFATFSGTIGAAMIYGGDGDDTLRFSNTLNQSTLSGGQGRDLFLGSVTIGTNGVSFWGGVAADTFNFTQITGGGAGATAYFWNTESGQDVIIFGNQISGSSGSPGVVFGITSGAASGFDISFAGGQSTNSFNGGTFSNQFLFSGNNTLVTAGFVTDKLTIQFVGGSLITLSGGGFNASGSTGIFTNFGAGTANFGLLSTSIPTFS